MGSFSKRTEFDAPVEALWRFHERPGAFERLNPPFDPVELVERTEGLEVGSRTTVRLKVGPASQLWTAEHVGYERGAMFQDAQTKGPFAKWVHTHRMSPVSPTRSALEDSIEYELPLGGLGALFGGGFTQRTLERLFRYRHALTALDLQRHAPHEPKPKLTFAITGATGLIGTALTAFLRGGGHAVRPVKRSADGMRFDPEAIAGADVVVHLAGASIADGRWTPERKGTLVKSRVEVTRSLVETLRALSPRPKVLLAGSAIGIYGDRGADVLDERSEVDRSPSKGAGFLSALCRDWEAEGRSAEGLGMRVVTLRTGIVLSANGGALGKMLPPFKAGAGGPLGGGQAYMSWIALEDVLGAILHLATEPKVSGPVNLTAPAPATNADFTRALGQALGRPAVVPVPAFALKTLFGEMAEGTILASQRVLPKALEQSGFRFAFPTLDSALRFTLGAD
ncbi:MAG: TIGR01777 family oxidoreductase [Myxococcaceae bacterium]|nr:TIGR01777 family oxidoreductase [Myxococcaceae bacterium]